MISTTAKVVSRILDGVASMAHRQPSTRARISIAALTVAVLSAAVKLVSLGPTLLIAAIFGTGDDLDAFFIAFMVPSFVMAIIAGSFSSAIVPTYVRVLRQDGLTEAQALLSRVIMLAAVLLCGATAVTAVIVPHVLPVLALGFSNSKVILTRNLFLVLLLLIPIKGMATIYASILHAHRRFFLVSSAPVSVPIVSIILILLWTDDSTRIFAVAIGTVVGMFGEMISVAWGVRRLGLDIVPRLSHRSGATRKVASQYMPMVAGALLVGGTTFVDQSMSASLAAGSVAALNYGGRLVAVVIHVLAGGLATAVLPYFSSLVDGREWGELRRLLSYYTKLIFYTTPVLAVFLALFSQAIVSVFLERGMFDSSDSLLVGSIQAAYAVRIPFYICGALFTRLVSALVKNQFLMVAAGMSLAANVILNVIFMELWGVVGIALSTSAVSVLSLGYMMVFVYRKLPAARALGASQTPKSRTVVSKE